MPDVKLPDGSIRSYEGVTTARDVAERTINLAANKLGKTTEKSTTATTPLPASLSPKTINSHAPEFLIEAIKNEMPQTLSDLIYRRSDIGGRGVPTQKQLEQCADIMSKELGWSDERLKSEIDGCLKINV